MEGRHYTKNLTIFIETLFMFANLLLFILNCKRFLRLSEKGIDDASFQYLLTKDTKEIIELQLCTNQDI